MIDLHSHVLPGIDDGSADVEESAGLIELLKEQGVQILALTPHFYASENTPDRFFSKRAAAYEKIKPLFEEAGIFSLLGAEVKYYPGISKTDLSQFRLEGTRLLLLEMPFTDWDEAIAGEVFQLAKEHKIVLAHIERYFDYKLPKEIWERLHEAGVLFQINCSGLLDKKNEKKLLEMIGRGQISFIASDTHSLEERPPRFAEVNELITKKLSEEQQIKLSQKWKNDFKNSLI